MTYPGEILFSSNTPSVFKPQQDGDLQSQARIRLSKDELRTDILSGDVQMTDDR